MSRALCAHKSYRSFDAILRFFNHIKVYQISRWTEQTGIGVPYFKVRGMSVETFEFNGHTENEKQVDRDNLERIFGDRMNIRCFEALK